MPGTKEIRAKILSVQSTQKITKAMQMVATSKMRRAQERMRLARPYAAKIRSVIGNLTQANPDYHHPFLQERSDVKNVGVIVISSDLPEVLAMSDRIVVMREGRVRATFTHDEADPERVMQAAVA